MMPGAMLEQRIQQQFFESADLQYQAAESLSRSIAEAASAVVAALTSGGKVLLCGLCGGAALSEHVAAVMVDRLERERPPLAALTVRPEPRAIQALGLPGDVLLLTDPCGRDLDTIIAAVRAAQAKDMTVLLLVSHTGAGLREALAETDVIVAVAHDKPSRVLETQLLALHSLCDAVDMQLMGEQEQ